MGPLEYFEGALSDEESDDSPEEKGVVHCIDNNVRN